MLLYPSEGPDGEPAFALTSNRAKGPLNLDDL